MVPMPPDKQKLVFLEQDKNLYARLCQRANKFVHDKDIAFSIVAGRMIIYSMPLKNFIPLPPISQAFSRASVRGTAHAASPRSFSDRR